jgi:hypothetical protein
LKEWEDVRKIFDLLMKWGSYENLAKRIRKRIKIKILC